PGMPFNQSMTIPLELKLTHTPNGPRLTWTPVDELKILRTNSHYFSGFTLTSDSPNPLAQLNAELVEIRTEFTPQNSAIAVFTVRGATILYDSSTRKISVNGHTAEAPLVDNKQSLVIYCDRTGLEIFASRGLTYVPMPFLPQPDNLNLEIKAAAGKINFSSLEVHQLRSAWITQ
ncbi:MAG: GH32 C-terminal domain-containing protein, partial [Verrucomicrobiae bacterium]|nr:GH32 C-terminal domain-containing protein [Verrucomicrobiae bacterium]